MTDSILDSMKEALGVPVAQTAFDAELTLHINTVLSTLRQLGVGPASGFAITGKDEVWADFIDPTAMPKFNDVKTYVLLRVKLIFDPPATSFVIDAYKEQVQEIAWRLNVSREETDWVDPFAPVPDPTEV